MKAYKAKTVYKEYGGIMANLRGTLQGSRGMTSRLGHETITSRLNTWDGAISMTLLKDGSFNVVIDGLGTIMRGNVDSKTFAYQPNSKTGLFRNIHCRRLKEK